MSIESEAPDSRSEQPDLELLGLLAQFVWNNDDCWYDHHGLCQAHNLHQYPCPHQVAKKILNEKGISYQ